ncbi:MAG: betC 3 [Verrucomicrobiaceae bacterium]|nr:betC 3 [Verrucomicrobiaceae bacterium]
MLNYFIVTMALLFAVSATAADKPNVLFIAVDDLNHWVHYLGRNAQSATPNIDKLAARGVRFSRSYCAAPVCNPSRAALMSGLRPGTTGVYENNNDWRTVLPEEQMLTSAFRKGGYVALGAGKIYHESFARKSEWDDYLAKSVRNPTPEPGLSDGVGGIKFAPLDCKDEALDDWEITNYGIDQLGKTHDKPMFLTIGLHKPHMPWFVPKKYYDLFPLDKIELPPHSEHDLDDVPPEGIKMAKPQGDHAAMVASGRWKEAVQGYLAACAYTDMNIGRLMEAFDKSAYKDNTIIVFWGDHGWHLGEKEHWRKFTLWEEAARAPLIWIAPGLTKPNSLCERTVDFMSIYPTLVDLCALPTPARPLEGTSIKALLANPAAPWDKPAMTTYLFGNHGIRSEGWRYIHYKNGGEELYNEAVDPYEWKNLADDDKYAAIKSELAKQLPASNLPDIGGKKGTDEEGGRKKKGKGKNKKAQ